VKKYKVDDIVYYEPFKHSDTIKSEILKNISKKSVILEIYDTNNNRYQLYDYKICIIDSGEIKKVKEKYLTFKE
tara:strand:- start:838 stop:1059 length:222 start_codon:yes stop_codon:yes gene_type:complete